MFKARLKGQRYDARLLPFPCVPNEVTEAEVDLYSYDDDLAQGVLIGTVKVLDSFISRGQPAQHLCVTLLDGTQVPAYRLSVDNGNWNVCQNYGLKAIKP